MLSLHSLPGVVLNARSRRAHCDKEGVVTVDDVGPKGMVIWISGMGNDLLR